MCDADMQTGTSRFVHSPFFGMRARYGIWYGPGLTRTNSSPSEATLPS